MLLYGSWAALKRGQSDPVELQVVQPFSLVFALYITPCVLLILLYYHARDIFSRF